MAIILQRRGCSMYAAYTVHYLWMWAFILNKCWRLPSAYFGAQGRHWPNNKTGLTTERRVCAVTLILRRPCRNAPGAPQTWSGNLLTHREGESSEGDEAASWIERLFNQEVRGSLSTAAQVLLDMTMKKLLPSSGATQENVKEWQGRGWTHTHTHDPVL